MKGVKLEPGLKGSVWDTPQGDLLPGMLPPARLMPVMLRGLQTDMTVLVYPSDSTVGCPRLPDSGA